MTNVASSKFLDDVKSCYSGIPVVICCRDGLKELNGGDQLVVAVKGMISKRAHRFVVECAVANALQRGASTLVFELEGYGSTEDLELLSAEIGCRAFLQLNHRISGHHALKEIRIACDAQQQFAVRRGLASQMPICFTCFPSDDGY